MTDPLHLPEKAFLKSLHISPRFGVVYVNNPKVACSSIKLTLQRAELEDPDYLPPVSVHQHEGSPLLTFPDIRAETGRLFKGRFVFSFVRNPFSRLRSAYLNKIVRRQKNGKVRVAAGFDANTCPPFADFIHSICAQPPLGQNPHWRPQYLNLSLSRIEFDMLGRLETFAADWAKVAAATGLPAQTSFAGKRTGRQEQAELTYDSAMIAAVARAYGPDFEAFDYDPHTAP